MANTDVMIDLETLDVLPSATILTIGDNQPETLPEDFPLSRYVNKF